jgi:RNA polymerase sigma factor (sigma-70 family)
LENLEKLIQGCQEGKGKAHSELYKRFSPMLFGVCLRYSSDKAEAEDTLHEGFITIFKKIGQYAFKGSFEGWMRKVVVNHALEKYRKRSKMTTVEDMKVFDGTHSTEDSESDLNAQQLMELINELSPQYKLVFNLYAIDGYNHKEIANMLNISEGTSKSNLARARKILQEKMKDYGFIKSEYAR